MNVSHAMRGCAAVLCGVVSGDALAQELVIGTATGGASPTPSPTLIILDLAATLPYPPMLIVAPFPGSGFPPPEDAHGIALAAADRALVTRIATNEIHVIDTASATTLTELKLADYNGFGTLAVDPAFTKLFVFTGSQSGENRLRIFGAPFSPSSPMVTLTMPGTGGTANSRAIAFDPASGRAFVGHSSGITAIDPPYDSASAIAFTIPSAGLADPRTGQLVALSPDGQTLVGTADGPGINVMHAPFSATSTPTVLTPPGAQFLGGAVFTPDGSKLLVVDAGSDIGAPRVFAISAPFDATSTIEALPIADDLVAEGLEDLDISADGQYVALTGNDTATGAPLIVLKAPFTSVGVSVYPIHIPLMPDYNPYGGRGAGTVRFWPTALDAPPQFSPDNRWYFALEGDSGLSPLRVDVHLSHPSAQTVSIDYATADSGSGVAGVNYVATSGTLTFAPGETRKHFSVDVIGNLDGDFDTHFFTVEFTNPVNATISPSLQTVLCYIADEENSFELGVASSPDHMPDGVLGQPYSATLTSTLSNETAWHVSKGEVPPGLVLNEDSGVLSGTPTYPGSYWFVAGAAHTEPGYFNLTIVRPGDIIFADGFDGGARLATK